MADADDVRHLALALPDVAEIESDGFDFRVAGKGFVWSYPERRPGKPRWVDTETVWASSYHTRDQSLACGEPFACQSDWLGSRRGLLATA